MAKLSLFEIQEDLMYLIEQLETGEATDELIEALAITEQNFIDKLEAYKSVIAGYNVDVDSCKKEKDRVNQVQKVKANAADRLKKMCLEAVLAFGKTGKSGNRVVEGSTWKMFTRNIESIAVNDVLVADITKVYTDILSEYLASTDTVETLDNNYMARIVEKHINSARATSKELGLDNIEDVVVSPEDIANISVSINVEIPLNKLSSPSHIELMRYIGQNPHISNVTGSVSKSVIKEVLKMVPLNIAKVEPSVSLQIK